MERKESTIDQLGGPLTEEEKAFIEKTVRTKFMDTEFKELVAREDDCNPRGNKYKITEFKLLDTPCGTCGYFMGTRTAFVTEGLDTGKSRRSTMT